MKKATPRLAALAAVLLVVSTCAFAMTASAATVTMNTPSTITANYNGPSTVDVAVNPVLAPATAGVKNDEALKKTNDDAIKKTVTTANSPAAATSANGAPRKASMNAGTVTTNAGAAPSIIGSAASRIPNGSATAITTANANPGNTSPPAINGHLRTIANRAGTTGASNLEATATISPHNVPMTTKRTAWATGMPVYGNLNC